MNNIREEFLDIINKKDDSYLSEINPSMSRFIMISDFIGRYDIADVIMSLTNDDKSLIPTHKDIIKELMSGRYQSYIKVTEEGNDFRKTVLTHVLDIRSIDIHNREFYCNGIVYKYRTRPFQFSSKLRYKFNRDGIIFLNSVVKPKIIDESEYMKCINSLINNGSRNRWKIIKE